MTFRLEQHPPAMMPVAKQERKATRNLRPGGKLRTTRSPGFRRSVFVSHSFTAATWDSSCSAGRDHGGGVSPAQIGRWAACEPTPATTADIIRCWLDKEPL
jgi:hypothetical protein